MSCGLELSSAWGTLRCLYGAFGALCGALRCSAFEMPYVVVPLRCLCGAPCCGSSEMSHVIPSRVFQGLKSHRWNCNVFLDPKKSEGTQITCDFWGGARPGHPNYVRLLIYQARGSNSCVRSSAEDAARCRGCACCPRMWSSRYALSASDSRRRPRLALWEGECQNRT